MHSPEHERLGEVVTVRLREQARPELVVLAFEERRVIAKAVCVEHLALEQHRRMEERRAEQRVPAHRVRSLRQAMYLRPGLPAASSSTIPVPTTAAGGCRRMRATRRSSQSGNATSSESSLATKRPCTSSRPRLSEAARPDWRSLVHHPYDADRRCPLRIDGVSSLDASSTTISSRSVDRLAQDAVDRITDVRGVVVDGDEGGDERHER